METINNCIEINNNLYEYNKGKKGIQLINIYSIGNLISFLNNKIKEVSIVENNQQEEGIYKKFNYDKIFVSDEN